MTSAEVTSTVDGDVNDTSVRRIRETNTSLMPD